MPHPGIAGDIRKLIEEFAANNSKQSARGILFSLRARMPDRHLPSERTIARVRKAFLDLGPAARRPYRYLSWPEAMLDGSLPWDSAPLLWELLDWYEKHEYGRPMIATAQWFLRVTLAAPGLNFDFRVLLAQRCAFLDPESNKSEKAFRGIESYIMAAPWESEEKRKSYEVRIEKKEIYVLPSDVIEETPQLRKLRPGEGREELRPNTIEVRGKIPHMPLASGREKEPLKSSKTKKEKKR